ncbi:MAG: ribosome biosis GTPase / thiamine phosphate phosphatase [Eubacteriaceae bacterium]|jgi:ribosome biogenesis GTPase|nr:ribosome biosis GTPase / thiamine phosphate phosphatase [Eubacteriaceae bacterium]MDK2904074.1 ribosome biosis GTPase / thiamine phosphate phosphatase [Eubacteriaceae bacterium]MDK2935778.1 ribosome biosis GTPase / thiamine phosphate phosphatase [Eubacteriaceae bacterium]MDK2961113.1 ribosome biosis GTPase / thiamine phosphate phosphatase [Eubacteriaceae bacterium]MDN5307183.1 ribosome biosis GTPase / thiamine phosphate phosphatase [Eubacteriaceae bacterium]
MKSLLTVSAQVPDILIFRRHKIKGRIIKGIGGFYYVKTSDSHDSIECRAKGILRHQKITPTVGDWVTIKLSESENSWVVESILERKNLLIRPPVANVDVGLIMFALKNPKPDFLLVDKLILQLELSGIEPILCFTKKDLVAPEKVDEIKAIYENTPYKILFLDQKNESTQSMILDLISGKTAFMAGPSGVGKSTLANAFFENSVMETGGLSEKLKRGKHTTRHVELLSLDENTYLVDTPGFSSLKVPGGIEPVELQEYFPDIIKGQCRFASCVHDQEPNCAVKEAVEKGQISQSRYQHYLFFLNELKKGGVV